MIAQTHNKTTPLAAKFEGGSADLLAQAIERVLPMLADAGKPTEERVCLLWAAANMAGDPAPPTSSISLITVAFDAGLIDKRGRWTGADVAEHRRNFGAQDIEHVIRWAMRGWNPFLQGTLT